MTGIKPARAEIGLALIFVALGLLWVAAGLRMPLWEGFAPQSGFLPLVYGALLVALSVSVLVGLFFGMAAETESQPLYKPLLVLLALAACVIGIEPAGFAMPVFLMLAFLFVVVEKLPLIRSLVVSACVTAVLLGIFKFWLRVPFPSGPFGI